ncbi:hypothetical protein AciX9_4692 (plasmid) [Granulicella tundricola MP5ACTX9]|uniref:Uncharacterized protein n=1 Tax=Granulicella tundricola (strain ATCC BAA-1859 / DSM 23138 / MP5ACTX9) TaxID=1198114 RepID=E8X835_GRATM|nr:hypothetical protein AciX9_4692 [Granulicella tundricola MP5ACTX9]
MPFETVSTSKKMCLSAGFTHYIRAIEERQQEDRSVGKAMDINLRLVVGKLLILAALPFYLHPRHNHDLRPLRVTHDLHAE